tara:strand:- start:1000 stop:1383 length:384 start_codon:yes stop_codon:yes gene_type:complete
MKMATRSPSNRGLNVPPPARNYQDNTQAVRRMPGVAYGEQKKLTEQQQAAPLSKDTMPQAQPRPARPMPQMDVFAATERKSEPVTSGLPFGPGVSPMTTPEQGLEDVKNFIYESWLATGDDSLLEFL